MTVWWLLGVSIYIRSVSYFCINVHSRENCQIFDFIEEKKEEKKWL